MRERHHFFTTRRASHHSRFFTFCNTLILKMASEQKLTYSSSCSGVMRLYGMARIDDGALASG